MFTSSTRLDTLLSIAFFLAIAGCGDIGSGCGCTAQPLPDGALPGDQTVEGGGQVRVTQAGFQKLTSVIPAVLNDQFADGMCVGEGSTGYTLGTGADYCTANPGGACGGGSGCDVDIHADFITLGVQGNQTLNIQAQIDAYSVARIEYSIAWIGGSCDLVIDAKNLFIDADIAFSIDPATGELVIELAGINNTDFSDVDFANCGILDDIADLAVDILDSFIGEFIIDLLTPTLNDLVQGVLPDPLGIEGMMDVGGIVGGVSPGTDGFMEARLVPGGYVQLTGGGMSLGLITGFNADEDPTTRTPDLDSEPHFCVPPMPAPNFADPPASLPGTARGTFTLQPAGEFLGAPEPADDLAIGLSETTLDLTGHHLVTSGGMCLGVGTTLIPQLNLGTFSLLVPSLATLGEAENPVLLVTRPQKAIDFTIGEGTEASPALTLGIHSFEVDVYVFVYERYTRAFTMRLDLDVGVNLTFNQEEGMPATVTPELVGLDADNIQVAVLNNEFVSESREDLEAVLPTIFDLAVGLLGDGLGEIEVPGFAGFTLNNLRVQKVTTSEDDFMAIYASLGTSPAMLQLADRYPSLRAVLNDIDGQLAPPQGKTDVPAVRLVSVDTPAPSEVRLALKGHPNADLPTVTLAVPSHDARGRRLEHAWGLAGGLWRPYREGDTLTISDRAFAWQGKYDIQVRSRVVGDYRTTSELTSVPVIIDSVGPDIRGDAANLEGGALTVPAKDIVSKGSGLVWAWGRVGEDQPWTGWANESTLPADVVDDLVVDAQIQVFVRDEAGNVTREIVPMPFHGQAGEGGCGCQSSETPTGGLVLGLMTIALLWRRRLLAVVVRHRRSLRRYGGIAGLWLGAIALSSLVPACNCGGDPGVMTCEVTEDCELECPEGEIPFCLDGICICTDDVPYGRIGPFSDVAVASNGDAWVSAYAESHGDLVVASFPESGRIPDESWEFVDGVPDGPVVIPDSDVRGGILDEGPDVGMYTSVAVGPGDTPVVTYFDRDEGSLKYATKGGDGWDIHVVDAGTGTIDPELGGEIAGLYSALTLRSDDGRPGVAYMAMVSEGGGVQRAEVRFAASQTPTPAAASDWVTWVVDSAVLPPLEEGAEPDPTPIPGGLGLFVDATRDANQAPMVVYYDRIGGDLKLARFDATGGAFLAPEILDGADGSDVGWYPSLAIDAAGAIHTSYLSATRDDLLYINTIDNTPVVIDDGYRIVGTTEDGLPKPEFHFVGDDSNMVLTAAGPVIIYQDATSHELLISQLDTAGVWQRRALAGDEADFVGAYGFFASAVLAGDDVVISTWVIDQPHQDQWVEIFRERVVVE